MFSHSQIPGKESGFKIPKGSKIRGELEKIYMELTPIERYALNFLELSTEAVNVMELQEAEVSHLLMLSYFTSVEVILTLFLKLHWLLRSYLQNKEKLQYFAKFSKKSFHSRLSTTVFLLTSNPSVQFLRPGVDDAGLTAAVLQGLQEINIQHLQSIQSMLWLFFICVMVQLRCLYKRFSCVKRKFVFRRCYFFTVSSNSRILCLDS